MALTVTIAITLVIYPNPDLFVGLFSSDARGAGHRPGVPAHRQHLLLCGRTMQALNGILLGYEKPFVPMVSTIVSLCIMQVPAAFLLSHTALGYTGIWLATPSVGWAEWPFVTTISAGMSPGRRSPHSDPSYKASFRTGRRFLLVHLHRFPLLSPHYGYKIIETEEWIPWEICFAFSASKLRTIPAVRAGREFAANGPIPLTVRTN